MVRYGDYVVYAQDKDGNLTLNLVKGKHYKILKDGD